MNHRVRRPLLRVFAGLTLGMGIGHPLEAQQRVARFEITSVGDTALAFRVGDVRWVLPGQTGNAIDPRRRDQLVARFRVVSVSAGVATAIVTGQTTAVSTDHMAVVAEPSRPWFKARIFWAGLLLGGALGAGAALAK